MTPFSPKTAVIFDYSGTLSLEAPRFARPANLLSALTESGLAKLGVTTPETFWDEIVGPTWSEGSTTAIGYKCIMAQRIKELRLAPNVHSAEIAAASSRFVDLYLAHSPIDQHWRPMLENLTCNPGAFVVIATDHYAEATGTIIQNLHAWKIPAQKVAEGILPRKSASRFPCLVANSADIGFCKADRRFWEAVRLKLGLTIIRTVLIIDDFGFNEEQGDRYAERTRVESRQKQTATALQEIFQASSTVIPFLLKRGERNLEKTCAQRIAEAVCQIDRLLQSEEAGKFTP